MKQFIKDGLQDVRIIENDNAKKRLRASRNAPGAGRSLRVHIVTAVKFRPQLEMRSVHL